jgi:hypothetical protein
MVVLPLIEIIFGGKLHFQHRQVTVSRSHRPVDRPNILSQKFPTASIPSTAEAVSPTSHPLYLLPGREEGRDAAALQGTKPGRFLPSQSK